MNTKRRICRVEHILFLLILLLVCVRESHEVVMKLHEKHKSSHEDFLKYLVRKH